MAELLTLTAHRSSDNLESTFPASGNKHREVYLTATVAGQQRIASEWQPLGGTGWNPQLLPSNAHGLLGQMTI